jgi:polar amino acid transport system substrate-binding protein
VLLSIVSFPLAIALGIMVALGRRYGPRWLAWPLSVYVEILRGTPLMLQLFVLFYVLPNAEIRLDAFLAAVLGLAINYSAYEAEIYRAGLQAVPTGQMEAALALGMSRGLALRRIVLPQAVRIVLPATTNDFIALFKDTSVCSVITVVELTKRYNIAAMSRPSEALPLALIAGVLYLAMSWPLALLSARLERSLHA